MSDLNLPTFNKLYPMVIEKYEALIQPESEDIISKINDIVVYLNNVGKLTNDVVKNWNNVMTWAMNDGLHDNVYAKVDELIANGTFATLLTGLFDAEIGDLSTAKTNAKDKVVNMVNELKDDIDATNSSLAENTNHILDYNNKPARAYGVYFNGYTDYQKSIVVGQIQNAITSGCDSLICYIDVSVDNSGNFNYDIPTVLNWWNGVFSQFPNQKWKHNILRTGSDNVANPTTAFFNGVITKTNALLSGLNFTFDIVVIQNESPNNTSGYDGNWQNVISGIKAQYPNIKVSMSPTSDEFFAMSDTLLNSLDFLGLNLYPSLSYNKNLSSVSQTVLKEYVKQQLESIYAMSKRFGKKVLISEIGANTAQYAYMGPGRWQMGTNTDNNNHLIWWQSVLPVIDNCHWIYGYGMFYDPLAKPLTQSYIKNYFMEGVEDGTY